MSVKRSEGTSDAFPKLSIKVREEIVGTKFPMEEAYPQLRTAPRLKPEELREMFEKGEDFAIVDMRNDYEYASGHFKGSIDPGMQASRDLPEKLPLLEPLKNKKVVTVCTGGIRCEKMSAYLLNNGFEDVYQLEDGIHGYMQKYPGKDFVGTLYTFDKRKTMHFGGDEKGNREIVGTCYLCETKTENYTNCANDFCHRHFLVCENCVAKTAERHAQRSALARCSQFLYILDMNDEDDVTIDQDGLEPENFAGSEDDLEANDARAETKVAKLRKSLSKLRKKSRKIKTAGNAQKPTM